jgi:hypothetical protein
MIRNSIKQRAFERDPEVVARDLGISFLLSYERLCAEFVCVLHPLSYLIKKANFSALRRFRENYRLLDALVFSSGEFSATSKATCFPVVAALYERNPAGMDWGFVRSFRFQTREGTSFAVSQFDGIGNYIAKYPNRRSVSDADTAAYFYTLRDINALKRSATFLKKETANTVRVTRALLPYYCYVDVFKEYISHVPYYLGNCDVCIDNAAFQPLSELFVQRSLHGSREGDAEIDAYFRELLGAHWV